MSLLRSRRALLAVAVGLAPLTATAGGVLVAVATVDDGVQQGNRRPVDQVVRIAPSPALSPGPLPPEADEAR